jgi:hypothetical protein
MFFSDSFGTDHSMEFGVNENFHQNIPKYPDSSQWNISVTGWFKTCKRVGRVPCILSSNMSVRTASTYRHEM